VKKITLRPKDKEYMFLDADNVTPDDVITQVLRHIPAPVVPLRERTNVRASA